MQTLLKKFGCGMAMRHKLLELLFSIRRKQLVHDRREKLAFKVTV